MPVGDENLFWRWHWQDSTTESLKALTRQDLMWHNLSLGSGLGFCHYDSKLCLQQSKTKKTVFNNGAKGKSVQFQKISILQPLKGLEFPGSGGFCKAQKLKKCMKLIIIGISTRLEVLEENPFCGDRHRYFLELHNCGDVLTSWWVVHWFEPLARVTVLCPCARHFTLTVPLSTQVFKWVPENVMLRGNPAMD